MVPSVTIMDGKCAHGMSQHLLGSMLSMLSASIRIGLY